MSVMTYYLSSAILNKVLKNTNWTQSASVYAALFTTATDENGNGTEVSGGSYARKAITFGSIASGVVANSGLITFDTATANWGTITHFGIYDALTSGNMLLQGELQIQRAIYTGDTYTIQAGDIVVTF